MRAATTELLARANKLGPAAQLIPVYHHLIIISITIYSIVSSVISMIFYSTICIV